MILAVFSFMLNSCDKSKVYDTIVPPSEIHFTSASLSIRVGDDPTGTTNVPVGVGSTDVVSVDRTVGYTISSPSGAVLGTDFTAPNSSLTGTLTIPAGQTIVNLPLQIINAAYAPGSIDTLEVYLSNPSFGLVATFWDTLEIVVKGPCDLVNPEINDLRGIFANSVETFDGDLSNYSTSVTSIQMLSPRTARVGINGVFDNWPTIYVIFDWSGSEWTTTVESQSVPGTNAGAVFGPTYNNISYQIRAQGEFGTFSACDETIYIVFNLGVTGVGWTSYFIDLDMAR